MGKRNIPVKNYFILGVLAVTTVVLTFYFVSWYEATREYKKVNSVISEVLAKIKIEEIDNFLLDNPNIVVYMASSKDDTIKNFEKSFKNFILNNEITDDIVYLDTKEVVNNNYSVLEKRMVESLVNKNITLVSKTNLLIVREGKIIDVLYKSDKIINESDVNQFLEMYEVIEP
jgi:hypothetical protein